MSSETRIVRSQRLRAESARTPVQQPALAPIATTPSFKHKAYTALKNAIVAMDIYRNRDDIRLDERKLAQDFGISRTPVREALAQLESEGFMRSMTTSRICAACLRVFSMARCAPTSTNIQR